MSEFVLNAEVRSATGKHAKYVRKDGKVPGVFYAHGEGNVLIAVPKLSLDPLIYTSETHIIDLKLGDGNSKKCILRDVQFDPVSDKPIHFDLQGLRENEKVTIEVPVVLTGGTPIGAREGGMVQHLIHRLKISCLPKDIPAKIEVDVANLGMNKSVHVSDLAVANATILENPESPVVSVIPPTVVKETEPAVVAEEALAEPEVVGKGKKAEEGEEEGEAETKPAAKEEKKEKK
ncbi:MAG: 50S ribosomal protein L25 [Ignavibacteriae bacterium]|nr:50S ribosomal protein L25 [Ignavibacteriota bacterium]